METPEPTETQLDALLALLCAIGEPFRFKLVSPFADRHGVWQARFSRRSPQNLIEAIGVACEAAEFGPVWQCEFSSAASNAGHSSSRIAFTTSLQPSAVSRRDLRQAFHRAVTIAEQLAADMLLKHSVVRSLSTQQPVREIVIHESVSVS